MKPDRAFEVGVKGAPFGPRTVFAPTRAKAKYRYLLEVREAWPGVGFQYLTCRGLGALPQPPTPAERAQAACDAFNRIHPPGTRLAYWPGLKEGEPAGVAPIGHPATVVSEHAVVWLEGVRSCISLTHVEPRR